MKREKFDQLYQDYYRLVLHVAYDIVQDYGGAQDVYQELFIKLDEKIESLDEEPIKGWILRNTYRKSIDYLRKSYRKKEIPVAIEKMEQELVVDYLVEAEMEEARQEFRNFVMEELRAKNPTWYDLVDRIVLNNESAKTVAQEYGVTVMNLRMKISRARRWLNKHYYHLYKDL